MTIEDLQKYMITPKNLMRNLYFNRDSKNDSTIAIENLYRSPAPIHIHCPDKPLSNTDYPGPISTISNYSPNPSPNPNPKKQTDYPVFVSKSKPPLETATIVTATTLKNKYIRVFQKDTLFWCYYIIQHGNVDYNFYIQNTKYIIITEKDEKFKCIETLRLNKPKLKNKIKNIQDIEHELVNNIYTSLPTFFALCIANDVHVMYINNNVYYEYCPYFVDDDVDVNKPELEMGLEIGGIHVIHCINKKYVYEEGVGKEQAKEYRRTKYKMESIYKTIKSASSYKVQDLIDIGKKINVNTNLKMKKEELYNAIVEQLNKSLP